MTVGIILGYLALLAVAIVGWYLVWRGAEVRDDLERGHLIELKAYNNHQAVVRQQLHDHYRAELKRIEKEYSTSSKSLMARAKLAMELDELNIPYDEALLVGTGVPLFKTPMEFLDLQLPECDD